MPQFAANLSLLFTEAPLLERFELAARAGFEAVEIQFPYAVPTAELRRALADSGLQLILHNLPAGDWAAGERGIACHPERIEEFRRGVDIALDYARTLGVRQLNGLAGIAPPGVAAQEAHRVLRANLRHAADELGRHGLRLLIEPINTHDVPGFFVSTTRQALELIEAIGADNVRVQYDVYHMQRMEGELAATLEKNLARIGHIQIADNPGRHEPGSGEIRFDFLFDHLDRIGYAGWIGCEYQPSGTTRDSLAWLEKYR